MGGWADYARAGKGIQQNRGGGYQITREEGGGNYVGQKEKLCQVKRKGRDLSEWVTWGGGEAVKRLI